MKQRILFILLILFSLEGFSQFGGASTYDFLNLASSARVSALGGSQVGIVDSSELSLSYYNPATLMPKMHNNLTVNYCNYISDINFGYVSYARNYDSIGTFSVGIQYINYGNFKESLENGTLTGNTFTASDYALSLIYSRNIWNNITVGIDVKPIYSVYESYNSFGIAADLGVSYIDSAGLFSAGLVFKNIGTQINSYQYVTEGINEPLPFDIQIGFSQKLAHAPLRFDINFNQLHNWHLSDKSTWDYDHKDNDDYTLTGKSDDILKQTLRHIIFGVEFVPSQNFSLSFGYNYQRKQELSVSSNTALVGLSGGFNVKISKFRLSYAVAQYHLSGLSNMFSIGLNLSEFKH
jgi:hypothetical protein